MVLSTSDQISWGTRKYRLPQVIEAERVCWRFDTCEVPAHGEPPPSEKQDGPITTALAERFKWYIGRAKIKKESNGTPVNFYRVYVIMRLVLSPAYERSTRKRAGSSRLAIEMERRHPQGLGGATNFMGKIAQYKLGDVLGVGTVGTVYRATDRLHDQKVAIKILLPQILDDSHVARRFHREMSILEKLDHPHIVRYLTGGTAGGRPYYVMELVDAGSLKDQLTIHGHLSWQQACRYAIQICSALQHAHNHGIIHRDLKPSNLFMDESGNLKLGDFGIARDTHQADLTEVGLTVGTYAYMSPEQICADTNVSDKTDLYALGCLLYEMMTGYPPFDGENFARIFDQHLNSDAPKVRERVPDCPQSLEELVLQLMAKHPAQRPFNARFVQGFLQELVEQDGGESDSFSSRSAGNDVRSPGLSVYSKHNWLSILGLLGFVGLILVITLLIRHLVS